jgi:hypothetical protein
LVVILDGKAGFTLWLIGTRTFAVRFLISVLIIAASAEVWLVFI